VRHPDRGFGTLRAVSGGLDEVTWSGLAHGQGPAENMPELLRRLASDDADTVAEAHHELNSCLLHQHTVYQATAVAVPFLAELARTARHRRHDLVWLLGMLGDNRHAYAGAVDAVVAAVSAQDDLLATLLDDDDARVREAAAYAAAGASAEVVWRRWSAESDPKARASLALALGLVNADAVQPTLADAVRHGAPPVRLAAAVALLRAGYAWPDGTVATLVDAIDDGAEIPYAWAGGWDWYSELLEEAEPPVMVRLLDLMLRLGNAKTRETGVFALEARCLEERSAPALLVPLLAPVVADAETDAEAREAALWGLRTAGIAAAPFADAIAAIAARYPDVASQRRKNPEFKAVATLMRLGDPRWVGPLCAAAAGVGSSPFRGGARCSPAVLAEVRRAIGADPATANTLAPIIAEWGPEAAAAVPELLATLPHTGPDVVATLLALGAEPDAVPHLRTLAYDRGNLHAAAVIWHLTGDPEPILDLLTRWLAEASHSVPAAASSISAWGSFVPPLLLAARSHLTGVPERTTNEQERQILAARIVAAVDGPELALPTVEAILAAGSAGARAAAGFIADLARSDPASVAHLAASLRDGLRSIWTRLEAAQALARLGTPTAELAAPLVRGVTDHARQSGLETILELRAVETIPGLSELLASDERLFIGGIDGDDRVWADELLCERIRSTIDTLRGLAAPQI
jgi:hypothetical protein